MRSVRVMFVMGTVAAAMLLVSPAFAKGERGTVRILIPPDGVIALRNDDAAIYGGETGLFEPKWDEPNVLGVGSVAAADLGTGYKVLVRFGPECPDDVVHQVIYPYVERGPQVFTPPGEVMCGGPVPDGYYPASPQLLHMLVKAGLPAADTLPATTASPEARAAAGGGDSGGLGSTGWLALAFLVAIAAGVAALIRADRRATVAS
jgi:hypothetical protein